MTLQEAIDLIRPGVIPTSGTWADIGAGTGLFTQALMEILTDGKVIALDKSPHALYEIGNRQWTIGNKQSAISNNQTSIGNRQSAIGNKQTSIGNRQSAIGNKQTSIGNRQSAIGNKQTSIGNKQSAIGNKQNKISLEIIEADFHQPLNLPLLDGIIMANSLHYAKDHLIVLKNVLASLKSSQGKYYLHVFNLFCKLASKISYGN